MRHEIGAAFGKEDVREKARRLFVKKSQKRVEEIGVVVEEDIFTWLLGGRGKGGTVQAYTHPHA